MYVSVCSCCAVVCVVQEIVDGELLQYESLCKGLCEDEMFYTRDSDSELMSVGGVCTRAHCVNTCIHTPIYTTY